MALVREPKRPSPYVHLPLGPARLYVDDIEQIMQLLTAAGRRAVDERYPEGPHEALPEYYRRDLAAAEARLQLGDDVVAESADDLSAAGKEELQHVRIQADLLHVSLPLNPHASWLDYNSESDVEVSFAEDLKRIVDRRRIGTARAWYARVPKKMLVTGLLLAAINAFFAVLASDPTLNLVTAGVILGLLALEADRSISLMREYGCILVSPLRVAKSRDLWHAARREAGLGAVVAAVTGIVGAIVGAVLS